MAVSDAPIDSVSVQISADTSLFRTQLADTERLTKGFATTLGDAFTGVAVKGKGIGDVLESLGQRLSGMALNLALKPLEQGLGSLLSGALGLSTFADGGVVAEGRVMPFAKGGVVAAPTYFPLAGGAGLMGEAGAEAILPLARGADGALGVRTEGGGATHVVVNISAPDPAAFRHSDAYLSGLVARAVARGQRGA